jgi:hypothetical protein
MLSAIKILIMAHDQKKQSTGNYKGKKDRHEKKDYNSDKKRQKPGWDGKSGRSKKK